MISRFQKMLVSSRTSTLTQFLQGTNTVIELNTLIVVFPG